MDSSNAAALRLGRIASNQDQVSQLLKARFSSATQIASIGAAEFQTKVPDIPKDAALSIHNNATTVVQRNEVLLASVAPALAAEVAPIAIGLRASEDDDINLDTIFENMTSTGCGHCCSVLSPSAYMVELLEFLGKATNSSPAETNSPRRALFARRPDLAELELSCANTNTEIPYVDLVNEILESHLYHTRIKLPGSEDLPLDIHNHQDGVNSAEILTEPQNINAEVYELLKNDVVPIGTLPFDRNLEQVRVLLEKAGASRGQLLRVFGDMDAPDLHRALVAEDIGMAEADYVAITGEPFDPKVTETSAEDLGLNHYWGFDSEVEMMSMYDGLSRVKRHFLPRTGYNYDQLIELLKTNFVNGPELAPEILAVQADLKFLWSQVDWASDETDLEAKYGQLLATISPDANATLASKLISDLRHLPETITISVMRDDGVTSRSPGPVEDSTSQWWMAGSLYFGFEEDVQKSDAVPFAFVDKRGKITSNVSTAYIGIVDERGQFLLQGNKPMYTLNEFSDPDKSCWLKHRISGAFGKLPRIGTSNGPVIMSAQVASHLTLGPESASEASGWVVRPFEQVGEPDPALMILRQLNGQPVSMKQWKRIHGFVRLQKKMGWTIPETDMVLDGLEITEIGPEALEKLASVRRLQKSNRTSLSHSLALTQGMSMRHYRNLFLKPGVLNSFGPFALDANGRPLFESDSTTGQLPSYCVPIAAAFGISSTEAMSVIVALGLSGTTLSTDELSLIYRHVLLCRAVKQPLSRLVSLLNIFGSDPFEDSQSLQAFLDLWKDLSQYHLRPEEWDFVFGGHDASGRLAPSSAAIVRTALQILAANFASSAASKKQDAADKIEGNASQDGAQLVNVAVSSLVPVTDATMTILVEAFDKLSPELVRRVVERWTPAGGNPESRVGGYFIPPSSGIYRLTQGPVSDEPTITDGNIEILPADTPIDLGVFNSLAGGRAYPVNSAELGSLTMSVRDASTNVVTQGAIPKTGVLALADYQDTALVMGLLSRYTILCNKAEMPFEDAEYIVEYCQLKATDTLSIGEIRTFLSYDRLRQQCTSAQELSALLRKKSFVSVEELAAALSSLIAWVDTITKSLLIGFRDDKEISPDAPFEVSLEVLEKLNVAHDFTLMTGLSDASRLFAWARAHHSSVEAAMELRGAMRTQVDDETWKTRAKALFDPLRAASRKALVAACVNQMPQLGDADGLFEHFLIDVSMGTCLKTSRLKQAISSIQIFVQRCLLGLERGVKPTDIDKKTWDWMSSYDLWQVNRRILLYPENWLEPSLRDNKSSVFKTIEASFSQGGVTLNDAVEAYVTGMEEVSNLEVIALRAGRTKDHIIARTRLSPHKFFYRTYSRRTGCWAPWESLPIEIPTVELTRTWTEPPGFRDQLIQDMRSPRGRTDEEVNAYMADHPSRPVFSGNYLRLAPFNGSDDRLILFIPTFTTRSYLIPNNPTRDPAVVAGTKYYWEVGLSYSERKNGTWSPRQTAAGVLITHMAFNDTPASGPEANTEKLFPFPRLRDTPLDQHLVREGSFHFIDRVDSQGRLVLKVYIEVLVTTYQIQIPILDAKFKRLAVFIGEFVYDNGQVRTGDLPKSKQFNKESPVNTAEAMTFQGSPFGSDQRRTRKIFATTDSPYEDGFQLLMTDDRGTDPAFKPPSNILSELDAQKQLWNGWTAVRPDQSQGSLPATLLSNNFAEAFQDIVSREEYRKVFEYFNQAQWHSFDPLISNVKSQGLGITSATNQEWYHEMHTPIALYNWELCVHLPMLLASNFASTQQLDEALDAIKLVFDPTVIADGDKTLIWRFAPFRETAQKGILNAAAPSQFELEELKDLPFNPFAIARQRTVAYMRWFAYKYIEVLLAKGDVHFRRFTLESISIAIQFYVEASQIFGPSPQTVQSAGKGTPRSYSSLLKTSGGLGADNTMKNALVSVETLFPFHLASLSGGMPTSMLKRNIFGTLVAKYFCIPANSALTDLRATIDDRLFKIRSCRDIEGNVRSLLLWEPPLDPGAVLRALANGLPIGSVADKFTGSSANFRFKHLIKMAFDLCAEVQRLGASILGLRRNKDAELLETLRVKQQRVVAERMRDMADHEIEEAERTLELITGNISDAEDRMKLYLQLIGEDLSKIPKDSNFAPLEYSLGSRVKLFGSPMSKNQRDIINLALTGINLRRAVPATRAAAALVDQAPDSWQSSGSMPGVFMTTTVVGGSKIASGLDRAANVLEAVADASVELSEYISLWKDVENEHLENQIKANEAGKDISGLYVEVAAQTARLEMLKAKRRMMEDQMAQHDEIDRFLRTKYTNAALYTWTINSLQRLYHESYNQALDVASQAEWAFRFERGDAPNQSQSGTELLGDTNDTFIKAGYWNTTYDGLLSGESLSAALRRLQAAYVAAQTHDFEISRVVSLRQAAPEALLSVRSSTASNTGTFTLSEIMWDMDFPGHYSRRIRSIRIRILCDQAAMAPLNATLTLLNHKFRASADVSDGYAEAEKGDRRFFTYNIPITSVAVGSSELTAGIFELNFDSERYMPFEGAGLISQWKLSLNSHFPAFDYSTIRDVELHVQYTSRGSSDSGDIATLAVENVQTFLESAADISTELGLAIAVDPRAELKDKWANFQKTDKLEIPSTAFLSSLPYFARLKPISVGRVRLDADFAKEVTSQSLDASLLIGGEQPGPTFKLLPKKKSLSVSTENSVESLAITWNVSDLEAGKQGWEISVPKGTAKNFKSLLMVVGYSLQ
ncbi:hypothetical protein LIA77_09448 [Sarocladium implicatum]|nr:hypothetical protein LIA77_09448 [Sarocladium implicatum]